MATKLISYRITVSQEELQALDYFLDTENPTVVHSNKYLASVAGKIKLQAFKSQIGLATPAYVGTGSVIRTKNVTTDDLGGLLEEVSTTRIEPTEEDFYAAEKELQDFVKSNKLGEEK